ncbi:MAG: hypothetical protein QOI61_1117 [Actinomycetota bacterium]|jgi:hypothetical protein
MSKPNFGPPPPSDFTVKPSDEEIEFFRANGFLAVERITTDEEIAWLTRIYEYIFEGKGPLDRGGIWTDPETRGKLTQFFNPEMRFPQILDTTYLRNAKIYAAAFLGEDVTNLTMWGHMIRKAPGGRNVPPHQDIAFWPPDYDYRNVNVWLPLHDCDVDMGTMQFRPRSHTNGCLPHHHYDHPSQNLLQLDNPDDLADPVPCPLTLGGCTFHDPATVHQTNPNATDRPRLAFPVTIQTVPERRAETRHTPWLDEFAEAVGVRQTTYTADGVELPLPV